MNRKQDTPSRTRALLPAAARGAAAGLVGVAVMTIGEKLEQSVTGRPNSYVPGRTLLTSWAAPPPTTSVRQCGTTPCTGARAPPSARCAASGRRSGLRGPRAHLAHTVVRLATDQTLENATGIGAPPRTWPPLEQVVDVAHKAVYSFTTGALADRFIAPRLQSRRGTSSH